MPAVPQYDPQQVALRPVTSAKQQQLGPEAFGVGVGADIARLGGTLADIAQVRAQEKDRVDEGAAKQLDVEMEAFERETLWNPETGFFSLNGIDALNAREQVEKQLQAKAAELEGRGQTPQQKEMFGAVTRQRLSSALGRIDKHALDASEFYQQETTNARAISFADTAKVNFADPEAQTLSLTNMVNEIAEATRQKGLGQDVFRRDAQKALDDVHGTVLAQLINIDPGQARRYLEDRARGQISGETLSRIEPALKVAEVRAEGMALGAQIDSEFGSDVGRAYAALNAITDPQRQQVARQEFEVRQRQRGIAANQAKDATLVEGHRLALAGTPFSQFPPALQLALADKRAELEGLYESVTEGTKPEKGSAAYLGLRALAVDNPEAFKAYTAEQLIDLDMHPDDIEGLLSLRNSMINGTKADQPDPIDEGYKTAMTRAAPQLAAYGIDNTQANRARMAEFQVFVQRELRRRQALGQPIDDKAINEAINMAMVPGAGRQPGQRMYFENRAADARGRAVQNVPEAAAIKRAAPELYENTVRAIRTHQGPDKTEVLTQDVATALARYEATGYRSMIAYRDIPRDRRATIETEYKRRNNGRNPTSSEVEEIYTVSILRSAR